MAGNGNEGMMAQADMLWIPAGAWDCHVHVVGPRSDYPMVEDRQYTAGPATLDDLKRHLSRHGLSHAVIIQPSFYGTDNRCMNDTLRQMDGAGRGIAVLPEDVTRQQLRELHALGIRGVRINLESAAVRDPQAIGAALAVWADRIAPYGWHIQTYAAPDVVAAVAERIDRLPVKFVLDHFAMIPASAQENDPRVQAVLALLRGGNTYVKLSAPYRISASPADEMESIARLAKMFHEANPARVLWGTDWPHTNREKGVDRLEVSRYRTIPDPMLTGALMQWREQPLALEQIFVSNPHGLYR
jgi:predicted TIM-barrel fold metal-dependent hydrolase